MKSTFFKSLFFIAIVWTISGCAKDEVSPWERYQNEQPQTELSDVLTVEEDEFLASVPEASNFTNSNIVLPNGYTINEFLYLTDSLNTASEDRGDPYDNLGPQAAKNRLIAEISKLAEKLVNKDNFKYDDEGANKPKQHGLAYSYGSRDYTVRYNPRKDNCLNEIYGLDCSGLMYVLFENAGVDLGKSSVANDQRQKSFLEQKVRAAIPSLDKIKADELGTIPTNKFLTGDIIYWTHTGSEKAFHIGIILKRQDNTYAIFQANGAPDECSKNLAGGRGPRTIELNQVISFFKTSKDTPTYHIVRLNADISGKWGFYARCTNSNYDVVEHNLEFPTSNQNKFTIEKPFTDYDGSPNQSTFNFEYDNSINSLNCEFITTDGWISGFERKDHFTVKLDLDDTGYIAAPNYYIHNGNGCNFEIKLVNQD